jgi:hypothetical protein
MENNLLELRIVGPQFSDTGFFVVWLQKKFSSSYQYVQLIESDSAYEFRIERENKSTIHAMLSRAPYLYASDAYKKLLDGAESILILLCRARKFDWLNNEELKFITPYIPKQAKVVVAANDSFCFRDEEKLISLEEIKKSLKYPWPVLPTVIGSFEKPNSCSEGAEEVLYQLIS